MHRLRVVNLNPTCLKYFRDARLFRWTRRSKYKKPFGLPEGFSKVPRRVSEDLMSLAPKVPGAADPPRPVPARLLPGSFKYLYAAVPVIRVQHVDRNHPWK